MTIKYLTLISTFLISLTAFTQTSGAGTEIDSLWGGTAPQPYLQSILQAPVLVGTSVAEMIRPASDKICFDKIIKVKSTTSRGVLESCLFLNTKIGLIGYFNLRQGATATCDIKPEDPDFNFNIVSLKGNVFTYTNRRKNGEIQHWVTTGNSDKYLYQYAQSGTSAVMHKKTERRDYCDGKIKTYCYKYDGSAEQWFLFGKNFPEELHMEPRKYLGSFGIGFQNTDKGLFIIMELVSQPLNAKITDIRDARICFDPRPFKVFEDENANKQREHIRKQRERLERDAAKAQGKPCVETEMVRINYQKKLLDEMEQDIQNTSQQNAYQSDNSTQKKRNDLTMNYKGMIQVAIYETKHKICLTERDLSQAGSNASSYQRKLDCLNRQLEGQMRVQREMEALDIQHARDPNMAFAKKARLFLEVLNDCGL